MPISFSLRPMTAADSPALAKLTEQSPDSGTISFSPRFHLPAYDVYQARHGDVTGVVAEAENVPGLLGAAHVSFGECQFEGQVRSYALLSSLIVHPDYRQQGIATALANWRIEKAVERQGKDGLILADIQSGNVGSTANAKKWASQITGKVITCPVPMRGKPVKPEADIIVREAGEADLETIAQQLKTFYRDYNFYRPQSAEKLRHWLHESPFETPISHYFVATDHANRLLAGMGIKEDGRLMSLYIDKVPAIINIANIFLKVIPPDHEMRPLQAEKCWFAPGQLKAAQYLWQTMRYDWRDRGSNLIASYDPRSPIQAMMQIPVYLPTTSVSVAMHTPVPLDESKLFDPLI